MSYAVCYNETPTLAHSPFSPKEYRTTVTDSERGYQVVVPRPAGVPQMFTYREIKRHSQTGKSVETLVVHTSTPPASQPALKITANNWSTIDPRSPRVTYQMTASLRIHQHEYTILWGPHIVNRGFMILTPVHIVFNRAVTFNARIFSPAVWLNR